MTTPVVALNVGRGLQAFACGNMSSEYVTSRSTHLLILSRQQGNIIPTLYPYSLSIFPTKNQGAQLGSKVVQNLGPCPPHGSSDLIFPVNHKILEKEDSQGTPQRTAPKKSREILGHSVYYIYTHNTEEIYGSAQD